MIDKRELVRYSFKMASDEEGKILELHRRLSELDDEKNDLMALIQMKQARKKRLTKYQDQVGEGIFCPECWGNYENLTPLVLDKDSIYRCKTCKFIFAAQEEDPT
jgi:DNA-directed RNA polymerase subunit RPC12/RpoP